MEEAASIYEINISSNFVPSYVLEDICGVEMSLACIFVPKKAVAKIEEICLYVTAKEPIGRNPIVDQLPNVLCEATPEIEERTMTAGVFEEGKDARVGWVNRYREAQESKHADTGVCFRARQY